MKEAEEKARTETAYRVHIEAEATQLKEKVKKLETECIKAIGEAQEDGKKEVMAEVRAQLQSMFNAGFQDNWKLALQKAEVPKSSELFLLSNTPLPYLDAGLTDSEDEGDEEGEGNGEAEGEQDNCPTSTTTGATNNPATPSLENQP